MTRPGPGAALLSALLVCLLSPGIFLLVGGLLELRPVNLATYELQDLAGLLVAISAAFLLGLFGILVAPIAFFLAFSLTFLGSTIIVHFALLGGLDSRLPWLVAGAGIGALVGIATPIHRMELAWSLALPGALTGMIAMLICRAVLRHAARLNEASKAALHA